MVEILVFSLENFSAQIKNLKLCYIHQHCLPNPS